jgi:hypothetical protein
VTPPLHEELAQLRAQLEEARAGNALIIHALNCALQWGEALFAYLPEGTVLPEGVKTANGALAQAMRALKGIKRD